MWTLLTITGIMTRPMKKSHKVRLRRKTDDMVRRVLVPKIVTITNILLTQAIIDINVMVQIRTNSLPVVSSELF